MITRTVVFLGALTLAGTAQAALYKCVNSSGVVTFTKTIRKGESCSPLLHNNTSVTEVSPVKEEKPSEPQTNFVLMCQEIEYTDFQLFKKPIDNFKNSFDKLAKGQYQSLEYQTKTLEYQTKRNENPKRPYFAVKYLNNKLSFNNNGAEWLDNAMPGQPNDLGWVGRIVVQEDSIALELKNTDMVRMRTFLQIDRYTGLYKTLSFPPSEESAVSGATGKCEKYSEKLF